MLDAFKIQDKEHFVSHVQVYIQKNCSVLPDLRISSVKLRSLLCGWLPSVCILNSSISMFYIYGREGTRACLECVFPCHGYNREKCWTVGKNRSV